MKLLAEAESPPHLLTIKVRVIGDDDWSKIKTLNPKHAAGNGLAVGASGKKQKRFLPFIQFTDFGQIIAQFFFEAVRSALAAPNFHIATSKREVIFLGQEVSAFVHAFNALDKNPWAVERALFLLVARGRLAHLLKGAIYSIGFLFAFSIWLIWFHGWIVKHCF